MTDLKQRVVWTALPDGYTPDGERLRVNLHVAPRLSVVDAPGAALADFPAWADWPATLASATIRLRLSGAPPIEPVRAVTPSTAHWQALLPAGETAVFNYGFDDWRNREVLAYPLADLADRIGRLYATYAAEGGDLPRIADLEKQLTPLVGRRTLDLKGALHLLKDGTPGSGTGDATPFPLSIALQLQSIYHQPMQRPAPDDAAKPRHWHLLEQAPLIPVEDYAKRFDFHKLVAALGQHAFLMRDIGLVVPLEIPAAQIPAAGAYRLSAEVKWDGQGVAQDRDVFPRLNVQLDKRVFRAAPRPGGSIADGWLKADDGRFGLVQLDVDGAGLNLAGFTATLPRLSDETYDDEDVSDKVDRTGLPRLRTAGIQFAQRRRDRAIKALFDGAGTLADKVAAADAAQADADIELWAEDVIRGWRADVQDGKGRPWRSLQQFDGTYRLLNTGETLPTNAEEAILRLGVTSGIDDPASAGVVKASEAMFGWAGWSLAAPEPGAAIMPDDAVGDASNDPAPSLPLHTSYRATKQTLPTLRFGKTYAVRVRFADLAGGGERFGPSDGTGAKHATPPLRFGRFEPVETPVLAVCAIDQPADAHELMPPREGESMARAAIRTLEDAPSQTIARRLVAPARVGHRFAEQHGMLDDADGRPRPELFPLLTARDHNYVLPLTAEEQAAGVTPHGLVAVTHAWTPDATPGDPGPEVRTEYAVGDPALVVPYLPDPMCGGAAIRISGLPDVDPDKMWTIPFYGDDWKLSAPIARPAQGLADPIMSAWPHAAPFTIVAVEQGTLGWDAGTRVFTVPLGKAERARLTLSALIPNGDIARMKLAELLAEQSPAAWQKMRALIRQGRHWMFTPWRMLELVHAVQRPLLPPDIQTPGASRNVGAADAAIRFETPLHSKSTVRLDVAGSWIEIDDHAPSGPVVRRFSAQAFQRDYHRLQTFPQNRDLRLLGRHVFADTRARRVFYTATATTRFREFLPEAIRGDAKLMTRSSAPARLWVPASAPPPAPLVASIVPTFGWSRSGSGGDQRQWRLGGGLRVYLERPWFVSGTNEMLGVCLHVGSDDPQESAAKNHVTQWGRDPVWTTGKIRKVSPPRTAFPLRVEKAPIRYDIPGLATLPEGAPAIDVAAEGQDYAGTPAVNQHHPSGAPAGFRVEVVPHAVGYDPERKLWYADIVVNPGDSYMPFIRLALARYQPNAVDDGTTDCHLSAAVLADFAQLTNDRLVITTPKPGNRIGVSVYGIAPTDVAGADATAGIFDVEVQALASGEDPDLGWHTAHAPPPLPGGPTIPGEIKNAVAAEFRKGAGPFQIVRRGLSAAQRALVAEGETLIQAGRWRDLLERVDILDFFKPPLIFEDTVSLPLRDDTTRLRLLVTESESYTIDNAAGQPDLGEESRRIVFAATVEV